MIELPTPEALRQKASGIKLVALDIDGVLTAGEVIYTEAGQELKIFNVKDGHGLAVIRYFGIEVVLITGRNSPINQRRAQELNIRYLFQGVKNKLSVLEALLGELGVSFAEVLYMGDDTPDISVLERVGLAMCPADAIEAVKQVCHYTTQAPGGRGAVREATDLLMAAQGLVFPEQISTQQTVMAT